MLEAHLRTAISKALKIERIELLKPRDKSFGDFALNIHQFKKHNISPEELINKLQDIPECEKIESVGNFINFTISQKILIEEISTPHLSQKTAHHSPWLLEHTSPNPNKAMHLGHLRNNLLGMAIANIWEYTGIPVVRDAIDNNRGIAIARLMWGYLKYARKSEDTPIDVLHWHTHQDEWLTPSDTHESPDKFVDRLYVSASHDYEEDDTAHNMIKQLVVDWEREDAPTWALWKHVLQFSYEGQNKTLQRLGNKWDKVWHEHEHYVQGKEFVKKGLEKGIFIKTDEGTIITQLADYNLTDTVLEKSDGTSLYITQDLALTAQKINTFHPEKLFWVIGPEQGLALKQLFAVCDQLGIGKKDQFVHIPYGWVSIKGQGKMSSRKGNAVFIDDLIDNAAEKIIKIANNTDPAIVETLALGAVKYSLLKVGRMQNISFDYDESVSFDGNSGPYLQYTYARLKSVFTKAEYSPAPLSSEYIFKSAKDIALLHILPRFEEVVQDAANQYAPHIICTYIYELAQTCNVLYDRQPILKAPAEERAARLFILFAASETIKRGLSLLGIPVLERI